MRFLWVLFIGYLCYAPMLWAQEQTAVPYSPTADTLSDQYKTYRAFFTVAHTQKYEEPTRALRQLENALDIAKQSGDSCLIASCYNQMGIIMKQTGDYTNAHQFYFEALKIYEKVPYLKGVAVTLNNIAMLLHAQDHAVQAIEYFGNALKAAEEIDDQSILSAIYHNAGETYSAIQEYSKALVFLNKAQAICENNKLASHSPSILADIAYVYWQMGQIDKAKQFYEGAIKLQETLPFDYGSAEIYIEFGEFHTALKQFAKADDLISKGLKMATRIHEKEAVLAAYLALSNVEEQRGKLHDALDYYKRYTKLKDSLFRSQRNMLIADSKVKYETEKKEQENELLRKEQMIHEDELEIRSMQAIAVSLALLGVVVVATTLYISNRQKQRANKLLFEQNMLIDQKREEIASQKEDIELKNSALEEANLSLAMKNERITDSLVYGQSVQGAVLPSIKQLKTHFQDAFILYRPKDIVSGDFYWIAQHRGKVFFAVADCTGHGVPGAFMALLGHAFLHEIIMVRKIFSTASILNALHETIVTALHQREGENHDGMTISMCTFEHDANGDVQCSFSGAKMDLLYYQKSTDSWDMIEGDRQSIGGDLRTAPPRDFQQQDITLSSNDLLYFFTDGYPDQANKNFRRFGSSRLIKLIKEVACKDFPEQQNALESTLDKHQSTMEQRDDITLIGLRI